MLNPGKIAILGAGAYGTALAQALARGRGASDIVMIEHFTEVVDAINRDHHNEKFLPGVILSPRIRAAGHTSAASGASVVFLTVPTGHADRVLRDASPDFEDGAIVVVGTKGFWGTPPMRGDEAARRAATGHPIVTMGGGGLAGELGPGQPTFLVAGGDSEPAARIAGLLRGPGLRVETSPDAAGVALCAALKNAYALGLAIFETGVPMGDNGRGAYMRIALHELAGLSAALGGAPETALGPAGLGDLVTTALSVRSRNRRLGEMLAAGKSLDDGIAELHHRPEGLDALAFAVGRPEILPAHFPLLHAIQAALAGDLLPGRTLFGMGRATA